MSAVTVYVTISNDYMVRLSGEAASVLLADEPPATTVMRVYDELLTQEIIEMRQFNPGAPLRRPPFAAVSTPVTHLTQRGVYVQRLLRGELL